MVVIAMPAIMVAMPMVVAVGVVAVRAIVLSVTVAVSRNDVDRVRLIVNRWGGVVDHPWRRRGAVVPVVIVVAPVGLVAGDDAADHGTGDRSDDPIVAITGDGLVGQ